MQRSTNRELRRHLVALTLLGLVITVAPALTPAQAAEDSLADIARANGLSEEQLQAVMDDSTARVGANDRVYYVEPIPEATPSATPGAPAAFPLSETFSLHSKPGSQRTIFLDFDGASVSGTGWNTPAGGSVRSGFHDGWDPADDGAAFSSAEKRMVQDIFVRVAEDYAPFDVNVTTADPGEAALTRTSLADQVYGARALISESADARASLCPGECGGVAYPGTFDRFAAPDNNSYYQPAWVFPTDVSPDPKSIAEAASHEIGHNLGLLHDGVTGDSYYEGHNGWAPIMGLGYREPISQWSNGEYSGANERQDDLAVINSHGLANRTDEAGGTVSTAAAALPTGTAYISTRTDVDVYSLGQCTGAISYAADPVDVAPNLDIKLTLLDAAGATVISHDPPSAYLSRDSASGLNAAINTSVVTGQYYLAVDGVGRGTVDDGYSDYGSLGAYTLTGDACAVVNAPGVPRDLTAVRDIPGGEVDVAWSAPTDDGGSAITRYDLLMDGAVVASTADTSASLPIDNSAHAIAVRAVNTVGAGPSAEVSVRSVSGPVGPTTVTASRTNDTATITWGTPTSTGGSPITGYQVALDDGSWTSAGGAGVRSHTFTGISLDAHVLAVRAINDVQPGTSVPVGVSRINAPTAPLTVAATRGVADSEVTVTWNAPANNGGAEVTAYEVQIDAASTTVPVTPRSFTTALSHGAHTIKVRAVNSRGAGPNSATVNLAAVGSPSAPTSVVATRTIDTATLTWAAPTSDGGSAVIGYEVLLDDGSWNYLADSSLRRFVWRNLSLDAHALGVRAVSEAGPGTSAHVPASRIDRPGTPLAVAATRDVAAGEITVTWDAPTSDGGAEVTGYALALDDQVSRVPAGTTEFTFVDVDDNAHTLRIHATNAVGDGAPVELSIDAYVAPTVVPPTVDPTAPSQPRIGKAKSGKPGGRSTVKIRWKPPTSDGGAEITKYQVIALKLKGKRVVKRFKKTVSGNKRGLVMRLPRSTYKFAVRAKNSAGKSPFSAKSNRARAR